jgi:hypothetical protein
MASWILERLVALEKRVAELEKIRGPQPVSAGRSRQLSPVWEPSAETLAWAEEKYPDVEEGRERDKFTDYWRSRGEVRKDWDAAYRNWIRREAEFSKTRPSSRAGGPPSRTTSIDQANRERRDRVASKLAKVWRE